MPLVPYLHASIISIVFPLPTISFEFPRFYIWFKSCLYLCVLRASPIKHRVCAVLFSRPLLSLYACVCHVLPYKHRVCAVLFSRFPFKKFVRLCFSRFVMRIFPHKHRVCAMPFPRTLVKFVRLSLSCYVMRTSPQEHQFRAVLFSRLP